MCTDGKCGRITVTDDVGCFTGIEYAAAAGISAAGSIAATNSANNSNQAIAGTNTAANAFMQVQNQAFNADQAQLGREYNTKEAQYAREFNSAEANTARDWTANQGSITRDFNAAEAQKNRDYQTEMSNSQYQRAVGDLKAAGLNPMLAYKNGGAGTPPGSSASTSTGSSAQASGPAASGGAASSGGWGGPGSYRAEAPNVGNAVNTGMAAMELNKKLDLYDAQIANVQADTAVKGTQGPQNIAQTEQIKQQTTKTMEETKIVQAQLPQIIASTKLTMSQDEVAQAQKGLVAQQAGLAAAQTKVANGQMSIQELQKLQITADTTLTQLRGTGVEQENAIRNLTVIGAKAATPSMENIGDKATSILDKINPLKWGKDAGEYLRKAW